MMHCSSLEIVLRWSLISHGTTRLGLIGCRGSVYVDFAWSGPMVFYGAARSRSRQWEHYQQAAGLKTLFLSYNYTERQRLYGTFYRGVRPSSLQCCRFFNLPMDQSRGGGQSFQVSHRWAQQAQ